MALAGPGHSGRGACCWALCPSTGCRETRRVGAGAGAPLLGEPWEGRDLWVSVTAVPPALPSVQKVLSVCFLPNGRQVWCWWGTLLQGDGDQVGLSHHCVPRCSVRDLAYSRHSVSAYSVDELEIILEPAPSSGFAGSDGAQVAPSSMLTPLLTPPTSGSGAGAGAQRLAIRAGSQHGQCGPPPGP